MKECTPLMDNIVGKVNILPTMFGGDMTVPLHACKAKGSLHISTKYLVAATGSSPAAPVASGASGPGVPVASGACGQEVPVVSGACGPEVPDAAASSGGRESLPTCGVPVTHQPHTPAAMPSAPPPPMPTAPPPPMPTAFPADVPQASLAPPPMPTAPSEDAQPSTSQALMRASACSGVQVLSQAVVPDNFFLDDLRVSPRVMLTNAQNIVDNMIKSDIASVHPDLFKGMQTQVDMSWTVVGYDLLNHKFPASMDMINCPLDPKLLMDLATIEDALPRARSILASEGCSGVPVELGRILGAWGNFCEKARKGTLVYSVVMVHAWLNNVAINMYQDIYEQYLWIAEPRKFDFNWHVRDFVVGSRACLMKIGALENSIDVTRMSAVEVQPLSRLDQNWYLIDSEYTQAEFKKSVFGEGIVPFFHDKDIMEHYVLNTWTTKCFPEGGYSASEDSGENMTWFIEGRGKYFHLFPSSGVDGFKLPGDFIKGKFVPGGHTCTYLSLPPVFANVLVCFGVCLSLPSVFVNVLMFLYFCLSLSPVFVNAIRLFCLCVSLPSVLVNVLMCLLVCACLCLSFS